MRQLTCAAITICAALVLFSQVLRAEDSSREDSIAMAMFFSFREASQVHLLAHALGAAAMSGTAPQEVIEQCDRAMLSYRDVSIPVLAKYLAQIDHDPQTREVFNQIQAMQQRALAEIQAIKAMAESGNGRAERMAFIEANRAYNEVVQPLAAGIMGGGFPAEDRDRARPPANQSLVKSPDRRVFSDDSWAEIAEELTQLGVVQAPSDAGQFFGTFGLLKLVFVEKGIVDPSTRQLFGLAKVLNVAFHQMPADKIETTLAKIIRLAKETGIEVASREEMLAIGDE